jgi:large subunit ribosomal protein L20
MARVKGALATRKRRKQIIRLAKGYWGNKKNHFKMANQQVMKSLRYAYVGRKLKKRDFRRLWITRISAACKLNDINYSRFINGLKKSGCPLNRKMLSEIAIADAPGFAKLVEQAKAAL